MRNMQQAATEDQQMAMENFNRDGERCFVGHYFCP